jgi:tetratricopeptide (TPR) repeat protein
MSTAPTAVALETNAGEGWLILRVALPRLVRWLERAHAWLDRYTPERIVEAADELRGLGGAEGMALLAAVPPERRAAALDRIELDDEDRQKLRGLAERLGDPNDERSPAAGLVRMVPSVEEAALEVPGDDPRGIAALLTQAQHAYRRGDLRLARENAQRALDRLRANGVSDERMLERDALILLGLTHTNMGEPRRAIDFYEQHLTIVQAIGDRAGEATTWHNLATIDLNEGAYAAARDKFAKSLAIVQAIGERAGEAATWHQLGVIDLNEGAYAAARDKFTKSLTIKQAIGERADEAVTWHSLASIDLKEGAYAAARDKFVKALAIVQACGDRRGEAATWHQLGVIDLNEGAYAAARDKLANALAIVQAIGDRAGEASAWHSLALIDLNEGVYAAARDKFAKALAIRQAIGDRAGEAATWHRLGLLAWKQDAKQQAIPLVALSFLLDRAIGHADTERALQNLSALCRELGISQDQFDEMLNAVDESYRQDRGTALFKAAFPD